MIPVDANEASKIAELRTMQAAGDTPRVAELCLVEWPAPDGPIYYATRMAADLLESPTVLDQLDGPIELRLGAGVFLEAGHDIGIADETINLDFWDADGELTRLISEHGAGVRVEVFYYFPDVDLFLSEWWGHLQPPSELARERLQTRAESGFRSSNLPMPARAFFTGCQAVFGGLLSTQAEIDEGDCPYNAHLGGFIEPITTTPTNIVGGTFSADGTFTKTAADATWGNSGFSSVESIVGDGFIEWRHTEVGANKSRMVGLSTSDPNQSFATEQYAFHSDNATGNLKIFESGTDRGTFGALVANTTMLKIERVGTSLKYYKNGVVQRTVSVTTAPLFLDVSAYNINTTVPPVRMGQVQAAPGTAAGWTNIAEGTPGSGGQFLKTGVVNAWDCGASHSAAVTEGEASMHFTIAGGYACIGFFTTAAPRSGNIETWACLQFNPDGSVTIKHSGTASGQQLRGNAARWASGGGFAVQLRGGGFHFYKGAEEILLGDFVPPGPIYPLYLGVAIQTPGAGITSCFVTVGDAGPAPAFGLLNPATGLPFTSCPRNTPAECVARLGDSKSYLAFDTVAESHVVHETKGPNITVTSRGNENNLKRPLRVIAGQRHVSDLDLLAFVVEPNTKHPDEGSVKCLYAICEGKIKSITGGKINSIPIGVQHLNYRLGEKRQGQTSFSPNILNYSGTALFLGVAQGDFTAAGAEDLRGEVDIEGAADVRVYRDYIPYLDNFTEEYTTERGWWLLHCLRNKRWGYGLDAGRVNMIDFFRLHYWFREVVGQKDKTGADTNGPRSQFNAELIERTAQQQIADICLAGRLGLPFAHRGLLRVLPLRMAEEIFSAVVFTDKAFWGCLARAPTTSEHDTWMAALAAARAISNAALLTECQARELELFHSAEYTTRGRTDAEFVTDCYYAFLRREPDPAGYQNWLDATIAEGREHTLAGFYLSPEFQNQCSDKPVVTFTDRGEARNVCVDTTGKSSLGFSMQSDAELCNRIVLTFDDASQNNSQVPLTFEDVEQQLRAGRSFGDTSRRVVEKQYNAFGVTTIGEAGRLGNLLLDLGEFDEGGLQNNLRATFTAWYLDTIELHKYSLIRIECDKLDQINAGRVAKGLEPAVYFRVRSITRKEDLTVEISAQAYPVEYYEQLELLTSGPMLPPLPPGEGGFDPADPIGPPRARLPYDVPLTGFGTTTDDQLYFTIGRDPIDV